MIAAAAFSARGVALARRLREQLPELAEIAAPQRFAGEDVAPLNETVSDWAGRRFESGNALLFVGAAGIAVRAVAPHIVGKARDPAVLCVDERGAHVIPLLGGHLGGANALAERVAGLLGAVAVITTATDLSGRIAFDAWAAEHDCAVADTTQIKYISAALLAGETVGLACDFPMEGTLPAGVKQDVKASCGVLISLHKFTPYPHTLHLIPRCIVVGTGCRKGADPAAVATGFQAFLEENKLPRQAVAALATIDRKADEPALRALSASLGVALRCYSAAELAAVPGDFSASAFVQSTVGVDNVCERAACRGGARLLVPKTAAEGATFAAAITNWRATF